MEQLLGFIGPKVVADTAVGGIQVFLLRGDGTRAEEAVIANSNAE